MSAADKIAQELIAIPQEFQEKAIEATLRSQFWEIIDCPVTLDLALAFAKQDGADPICRLRKCARALALKTQDQRRANICWRFMNLTNQKKSWLHLKRSVPVLS